MTRAELEVEVAKIRPCPFCGRKANVRVVPAEITGAAVDYYSLGCSGMSKECWASEIAQALAFPLDEAANMLAMWNRRA